ncbi:type II toxin-antitoxin system RelE/ParE family toxin [Algoriphagus sp. A40]|uniref:type II toxin-antitoxin system RelE/ParE family toxin n=1 Tax=Algoriphagus sp. A40 TaxID=1945863 RepID=UPI000987064C|nr:type II toxin-antitoxin system RelE/ParE family toxin [Algoriphagus sp. A40]OOG74302.1 hypothetical protein B0E43_11895 [Algoriphagus sp. A40]
MKIFWSEFAKNQLREIYHYYSQKASLKVANQIKSEVFRKVKMLISRPEMGQIEPNLKESGFEFRYLVAGNFKIIYMPQLDHIFITDIFDTRRDPEKMNKSR